MASSVDIIASVRLIPFEPLLTPETIAEKLSAVVGVEASLETESDTANLRFNGVRGATAQEVRRQLERTFNEWRADGLIWSWDVFFALEPDPKYRPKTKTDEEERPYRPNIRR